MTRTVVVDGSNLATEGRPLPSLRQLREAVEAFRAEHPNDQLIIVADATFGHRIDSSEVSEFDLWVDHGQIVCPPAGAVGRGDAFVLSIATKSGATILSNDSFQEFHGSHPWLFDEGRLVGGKPVPHVGWVFVARTPVRGPISRKAVQTAKRKRGGGESKAPVKASPEAFKPMPVPKAPPPGRARKVEPAHAAPASPPAAAPPHTPAPPARGTSINDLLPFLDFVQHHPVGSAVSVTFDTYSSHGAYANAGPVRVYVPLRNMADPAPRSAREAVKIGETRDVIVSAFNAPRRGVDAAFSEMAVALGLVVATAEPAAKSRSGKRQARATVVTSAAEPLSSEQSPVADPVAPVPAVESEATSGGRRRRGRSAPSAPVVESVSSESVVADPVAPVPAVELGATSGGRRRRGRSTSPTSPEITIAAPAGEPQTNLQPVDSTQSASPVDPDSATEGSAPGRRTRSRSRATSATTAAVAGATKSAPPESAKQQPPAPQPTPEPAAPRRSRDRVATAADVPPAPTPATKRAPRRPKEPTVPVTSEVTVQQAPPDEVATPSPRTSGSRRRNAPSGTPPSSGRQDAGSNTASPPAEAGTAPAVVPARRSRRAPAAKAAPPATSPEPAPAATRARKRSRPDAQ